MNAALTLARGIRPAPRRRPLCAYTEKNVPAGARPLWNVLPTNPVNAPQWLRTQAARPTIQTIILTDPFGDLTAQEKPDLHSFAQHPPGSALETCA